MQAQQQANPYVQYAGDLFAVLYLHRAGMVRDEELKFYATIDDFEAEGFKMLRFESTNEHMRAFMELTDNRGSAITHHKAEKIKARNAAAKEPAPKGQ